MRELNQDELNQLFPAECHFKVICKDREGMEKDLNQSLEDIGLTGIVFQPRGRSAKGTYITFDLSWVVESNARLRAMDEAIGAVDGVGMLL
ncbi:MAG: DUF493 family protein [Verrucomicrobiota bacterium]|nr:DUF493 family protein [Verrucomicrobiota bacterium]